MTDPRGGFQEAFTAFMRKGGRWRNCEPDALRDAWASFVRSCVAGYEGEGEDYFNELTARSSLERAFQEPSLARFEEEMGALRSAVAEIDESFRRILDPDAFPRVPPSDWWVRGMVKYAGPRLAEELRETHHVHIEPVHRTRGE
jgi:hypothetical protein